MKRLAAFAFVILPLLLMASCVSVPNWSGAETEAGEFVWRQTPGIRFYINIAILGALLVSLVGIVIYRIKNPIEKDAFGKKHTSADQAKGLGCATLIVVFFGYFLWQNIDLNTRTETYLINSERIEAAEVSIEWKNVVSCSYHAEKANMYRKSQGGVSWETGDSIRGITCLDQNKKPVTFEVQNDDYDTSVLGTVWEWIFGSHDYNFSPEEELRLKKAINQHAPENVKQKMSPETKEYLSKLE